MTTMMTTVKVIWRLMFLLTDTYLG